MLLAIELYVDAGSDALLRHVWDELAERGISATMRAGGFRPHVSLGVAGGGSVEALTAGLEALAHDGPPLALTLSSVGLFPGAESVIYLGVVVTDTLLAVHAAAQRLLAEHAKSVWAYYTAGNWVPHCTMGFHVAPERLADAVRVCLSAPFPIRATATEVALAEVTEERARELALFPWGR